MSGFVYIWYDRKHKRYYIGSHWGAEDDGYVCSSTWMKQAYSRRPSDFKRRVISRVQTTRADLLVKEYEWLSLIKDDEMKTRYYNLHKRTNHWHGLGDEKYEEICVKIGDSTRGKARAGTWKDPEARSKNISSAVSASYASEERNENGKIERLSKQMRGRTVITHVETQKCKRVREHELKEYLENGWRVGRPNGWMSGQNNPNLGKKREKKPCPKCGDFFPVNTLVRWHKDRCPFLTN